MRTIDPLTSFHKTEFFSSPTGSKLRPGSFTSPVVQTFFQYFTCSWRSKKRHRIPNIYICWNVPLTLDLISGINRFPINLNQKLDHVINHSNTYISNCIINFDCLHGGNPFDIEWTKITGGICEEFSGAKCLKGTGIREVNVFEPMFNITTLIFVWGITIFEPGLKVVIW